MSRTRNPSWQSIGWRTVCLIWLMSVSLSVEAIGHTHRGELAGRNLQFNQLTPDDGLAQAMIYDIVQDHRGFIWIATQEGLNRYDGYQLSVYEHLRTDTSTLSHDFIWCLLVDRDGTLWVGTEQGLNRYDWSTDAFDRQPFTRGGRSLLPDAAVRSLVQTRDGMLWIGTTEEGLFRVDAATGEVERFLNSGDQTSLPDNTILALLEDRKGNLWVGTENMGLYRLDRVTGEFVLQGSAVEGDAQFIGRRVRTLYEDTSGFIWVGTDSSGVSRFDPRRGTFERFTHSPENPKSLASNKVRDVLQDEYGTVWLATDDGLAEWREREQGFVTYRHDDTDPRSLINDRLQTLFNDASGVLWMGSWNGISRWNYFSDTFTYYRAEDGMLPGNLVSGIAESSDGTLWVATYGAGLTQLNPVTGEHHVYRNDPADPLSLPDDRVMAVHVDPLAGVWVGTRYGGLARLDAESRAFTRYRHEPDNPSSLSSDAISSLYSDEAGWLWIGTYGGGLNRLLIDDPENVERFSHDPADPSTLSGDRVLSISGDGQGGIFVGTFGNGLSRFDRANGRFQRYLKLAPPPSTGSESGSPSPDVPVALGTVTDLVLDTRGGAWLSTIGSGLIHVEGFGTSEVLNGSMFSKEDGMPTDTFYGVLAGQSDELWLSSNRGLIRFEPKTGSIRHFDTRNGLRVAEFSNSARLRSRNGQLLFGGPAGLVGFFPGELPLNDHLPSIVVTAHSRDSRIGTAVSGEPPTLIRLGYLDRFLSFDFVALDFMSPDKNQYRYQLEGFDPDWVSADEFRRAVYTNLPSGDFTFRVQAANNDGIWNREGVAMRIQVIPAPWRTWWAYLGYAVLASGLILYFLRLQKLKLLRESQQREQLEQEVGDRTRELAERNRELEMLNEKLAEASVTDSLTGLRNRRYVDQFIRSEVSLFERGQDPDGSFDNEPGIRGRAKTMFFMMIDLDGFKVINDRFGHHAGDSALLQVKDILEACARSSDTLIRWGGDEFMVIGFSSGFFGVKALAERIRESIRAHRYDLGDGRYGELSASIGIAPYPLVEDRQSFCSWELVVGVADQAAYIAKASGRNAWVSLSGTEKLAASMLERLNRDLPDLIESGLVQIDSSLEGRLALRGAQLPLASST